MRSSHGAYEADKGQSVVRLPNIRLDPRTDGDLIAWVQELEQQPLGVKGQIYKEILRLGLRAHAAGSPSGPLPSAPSNASPMHVIETTELLGDIRRVVEAAVESSLARVGGIGHTVPVPNQIPDEQEDISFLTDILSGLLLGEEE